MKYCLLISLVENSDSNGIFPFICDGEKFCDYFGLYFFIPYVVLPSNFPVIWKLAIMKDCSRSSMVL